MLGLWARYLNKGRNHAEAGYQTLADASQEFSMRVVALIKVVNCLDPHDVTNAVKKELSLLVACSRKNEGEAKHIGGGTFEWVDSLLIKCLREGRWLLVDNANLCSPAVLDRLNGLLEPNGELVLGERGVSSNGNLFTIKPHPNFRLFITVDPKYGEISRAMRNRGVEIFMTTNRSGILGNQHFQEMDLYALMTKCGLQMRGHQDLLIRVHEIVVANTYGSDDFTISQLLNAASLIVQLHSYGAPLRKAFKMGCNDVYLKNLNVEQLRKEKIAALVEQIINSDRCSSSSSLDIRDFYFQNVTTFDVQHDCDTSMASRQLVFIAGALKAFGFILSRGKQISGLRVESLVGSEFPSIVDDVGLDGRVVDLLPNLLMNVFASASKSSFRYMGRIVSTLTEKLEELGDVKNISGYICRVVEKSVTALGKLLKDLKFADCDGVSLKGGPWDVRRLLLNVKFNHKEEDTGVAMWSSENKVFALLYFIVRRVSLERTKERDEDEEEGMRSLKIETMTVLDYSEALKEGWLSDMVSNEPLISQFGALLSAIDDCVMLVLESVNTSLSTEKMFKLMSAMEWRFRLEESGKMILFDIPESTQCLPQVSQNARMMLTMHYKWLDKTLLPLLVEMIDKDSSLYSSQQANALVSLLGEIEISLNNEFTSPLLSLTKPVRSICGQSLPLTDVDLVKNSLSCDQLAEEMNLSGRCARKSELVNRVEFMLSPEGRRCRLLLVDAKAAILKGDGDKVVAKILGEAQEIWKSLQTNTEQNQVKKHTTKVSPEIKLLPINDLLSLRLNAAVRLYLLKNDSSIDEEGDNMEVDGDLQSDSFLVNLNGSFMNWTRWLQSSPPEVCALLSQTTNRGNKQKLLSLLLEQFSSSPAVKRTGLWLSWGDTGGEEDLDDYFKDDEQLLNVTSPLLSYFVALLAFPDSKLSLEIDSLRGHQKRVALLNALKLTLWRNVATLSCRQLDYAFNEEMCIRNAFTNFTQALQKSLIDKGCIKSIEGDDVSMETDCDDDLLIIKQITDGLESLYKQKEEKKVWRKKDATSKNPVESIPSMLNGVISTLDRVASADSTDKWLWLGGGWAYLGLAQLIVFSCVEAVDPVQKSALKLGYMKQETTFLERTIFVEAVQACNSGASDYVFREEFDEKRRELLEKQRKLEETVAVRPDPPMYNNLIKDFFHLTQNICSVSRVETLMSNLSLQSQPSATNTESVLKETALWFKSVETFTAKFSDDYGTWYPDVTGPILSSIKQIKYGIRLMMCGVMKCSQTSDGKFLNSKLQLLSKFPLTSRAQVLELVDVCTSRTMVDVLEKASAVDDVADDDGEAAREGRNATFRLAKFCLQEMHNVVQIKGDLSDDWNGICGILNHVVYAWEQQEEEKKNKILAEESLYINKVRSRGEMPTEDEEADVEISAFFNPNRESDFGDLEPVPLEGRKQPMEMEGQEENEEEAKLIKLTVKDLQEIHRIHSEMVRNNTVTHWRQLDTRQHHRPPVNFIAPYQERFAVFKLLLKKFCTSCDVSVDYSVGAGLCVATEIASRAGHVQDDAVADADADAGVTTPLDKRYDFYNDAHIGESRQCLSLLKSLLDRVGELMQEWPDHPTLNQIVVLVERIMSFDASSAVARFLTGLELVLTKVREWEENAHSGVSLANHMSAMVRQVIAWRKLELSCWKGCLFATRNRLKGEVSKWWFHLYALVAAFMKTKSSQSTEADTETEKVGECELVKALQSFMEKSTLVEFGPRLELLLTFHCHCSNMTEPGHCEATSIFWNSYMYYKQFESAVEIRIKELGAGVEKKLADFVKIARWNEITYWSVKETVQKTHRTLHKYIKEYEGVLNESVLGALVKLDFPQKKANDTQFKVDLAHYVTVNPVKPVNDFGLEVFIMGAEMSILKKACKFSKLTIQKMRYGELIGVLDDLAGEIVKTSRELSDLEVDRSLTKEKQKSQAKSYLQQKRKALTDLFRVLSDLGLSYRTGLVVCPDESTVLEEQFVVAPLNVEAAMNQIDNRDADKDILAVWNAGGERHFWHAIARTAQLKKTLRKPHKEIGPPIIERCKGFTNHLMKITVDEKKLLTETSTYLYQMRCYTKLLAKDVHYSDHKKSEVLIHCQHELQNLLNDCVYCLEQFKVLLDACPAEKTSVSEGETSLSHTMLDVSLLGPMILAHKGDSVWSSVVGKLNHQIHAAKSVVERIERANRFEKFSETLKRTNPTDLGEEDASNLPSFLTSDKYAALKESVPKVSKLVADLNEIRGMFDLKVSLKDSQNPFVDFLSRLTEKFQTTLDKIIAFTQSDQPSVPSAKEQLKLINKQTLEEFANKTDDCTSSILIAIQELYKKYGKPSDADEVKKSTKSPVESEVADQSEELEENHLKTKVVENIGEDVAKLNLAAVTHYIEELLEELALMEGHDRIACKSLLERCCPLFDQYLLLAQFVITHQLSAFRVSSKLCSVLSALFVNLSQKGFCTPEDLADELEDGGESEVKGGMGLGEGEGQKDVSDQIESEDQLEDARPQGEQREEEEKECREEEKGIEMSEDFGGKLQDLEKKDNEDEDKDKEDEEDGEEPDKEMGETEKGAETLDQEIWGSDSDEEEGEGDESEKKEEQGDRGEQMGEKEWGAKDEGKEPTSDDKESGNKERKDDEKEEINEMEEKEGDDEQIDPYHNKNQQQPEVEEFDLPEDLNLDDGEAKDQDEEEQGDKENPFDIDTMKDMDEGVDEDGKEEDKEKEKSKDENEPISDDDDGVGEEELKMNLDDTEEMEEEDADDKDVDEGGMKDDKKSGEEDNEKSVDERNEEEQAKPSDDGPAVEEAESAQQAAGSKDEVASRDPSADDGEKKDAGVSEGPDQEGVGHAEQDESGVGHGGAAKQTLRDPQMSTGRDEKRQRPGESDDQHTLGNLEEPVKKKVKTIDAKEDEKTGAEETGGNEEEAIDTELYQHITDATRSKQDVEVVDAATKEQYEKQPVPSNDADEEMKAEEDVICLDEDDDVQMIAEDELPAAKSEQKEREKKDGRKTDGKDLMDVAESKLETTGDIVETDSVARGAESAYFTKLEQLGAGGMLSVADMRSRVEEQLGAWSQPPATNEAAEVWARLNGVVTGLAAELSEQLRLVLEPTSASRLKGDFRTGRRINMRKVIPYIASQFRKDKIWLRRTKPSKRDYQVVLAIDDSSSMSDNHSKQVGLLVVSQLVLSLLCERCWQDGPGESILQRFITKLAFESLALVSKALTLLEVGQLSVVSFGEKPKVLHPLSEPFTEHSGAKLMQQLLFDQQKTQVGSLLEFACDMLMEGGARRSGGAGGAAAQLLVIVSDGRGVLDEGEARVKAAVRRARLQNVFTVFVVIDNPSNKDSILDIRMPKFVDGKLLGISSYMDSFPFPFYLILRDINGLPMVLSDALRQWFELVTNLV